MTTKTVRAESLPLSIQIVVTEGTEQHLVTCHLSGSFIAIVREDGTFREVRKDAKVTYTRDLTGQTDRSCTVVADHGKKMRTAKGQWYCKTCRKDSHVRGIQRKKAGIPTPTAAATKRSVREEKIERLMTIAAPSLRAQQTGLLSATLRLQASPSFIEDRFAYLATSMGLTVEQAREMVA